MAMDILDKGELLVVHSGSTSYVCKFRSWVDNDWMEVTDAVRHREMMAPSQGGGVAYLHDLGPAGLEDGFSETLLLKPNLIQRYKLMSAAGQKKVDALLTGFSARAAGIEVVGASGKDEAIKDGSGPKLVDPSRRH